MAAAKGRLEYTTHGNVTDASATLTDDDISFYYAPEDEALGCTMQIREDAWTQ